jgi:aspartyl-tRNA(Asn)/glutamyl-tRNA(Gln) amidotransferase subunit C
MQNPLVDLQKHTTNPREDFVTDGGYAEEVVKNAPSAQHNSFVVPKVVE